MSNAKDNPRNREPHSGERRSGDAHSGVATFSYDSGQPGAVAEETRRTRSFSYDAATGVCTPVPEPPVVAPNAAVPAAPGVPPVRQSLEFRLCGAEAQEQTIALAGRAGGTPVVAVERVRVFVTGSGAAGAAASGIGGVEVHAALREGRVVCTAQTSDFATGELVVVQVDVAIYTVGG